MAGTTTLIKNNTGKLLSATRLINLTLLSPEAAGALRGEQQRAEPHGAALGEATTTDPEEKQLLSVTETGLPPLLPGVNAKYTAKKKAKVIRIGEGKTLSSSLLKRASWRQAPEGQDAHVVPLTVIKNRTGQKITLWVPFNNCWMLGPLAALHCWAKFRQTHGGPLQASPQDDVRPWWSAVISSFTGQRVQEGPRESCKLQETMLTNSPHTALLNSACGPSRSCPTAAPNISTHSENVAYN
ncbi:hypothetical protein AOLI_G00003300 [Acnodon oligacanthus]